jgi:hypothetical protein
MSLCCSGLASLRNTHHPYPSYLRKLIASNSSSSKIIMVMRRGWWMILNPWHVLPRQLTVFFVELIHEFIWPFDSAKMLQISKFSAFLDLSSTVYFSVNTWPRLSTKGSIFVSRTRRFQCCNAKWCSINTNWAITIWMSFKFEFY